MLLANQARELLSTLLFFRTEGVLSYRNSLTHRFFNFHRTCAPSSHSLCSLSSTLQRTQPSVKFLSLYDWQNQKSFLKPCGHSSQNISHLILHYLPATDSFRHSLFGDSVSLRPLVQALGFCPASGAPWSSAMPPSLGKGRVTTTTIDMYYSKTFTKCVMLFVGTTQSYVRVSQI